MQKILLDYTFIAEFQDGTTYEQTPEDVSRIVEPGKRSAFTDLKDRMDEITTFSIQNKRGVIGVVDLTDGHFEINGVPFRIHNTLLTFENFKLIYYRDRQEDVNFGAVINDDLKPEIKEAKPLASIMHYCIGWEAICKDDGKKYQAIITMGKQVLL